MIKYMKKHGRKPIKMAEKQILWLKLMLYCVYGVIVEHVIYKLCIRDVNLENAFLFVFMQVQNNQIM